MKNKRNLLPTMVALDMNSRMVHELAQKLETQLDDDTFNELVMFLQRSRRKSERSNNNSMLGRF